MIKGEANSGGNAGHENVRDDLARASRPGNYDVYHNMTTSLSLPRSNSDLYEYYLVILSFGAFKFNVFELL